MCHYYDPILFSRNICWLGVDAGGRKYGKRDWKASQFKCVPAQSFWSRKAQTGHELNNSMVVPVFAVRIMPMFFLCPSLCRVGNSPVKCLLRWRLSWFLTAAWHASRLQCNIRLCANKALVRIAGSHCAMEDNISFYTDWHQSLWGHWHSAWIQEAE